MANLLTHNSRFSPDAEAIAEETKEFVKELLYKYDRADYPHHEWGWLLQHSIDMTLSGYLMLKMYPMSNYDDDGEPIPREWPPKPENWG